MTSSESIVSSSRWFKSGRPYIALVLDVVETAVTHQPALVELAMFHEFQDDVLSDVDSVPMLVDQLMSHY